MTDNTNIEKEQTEFCEAIRKEYPEWNSASNKIIMGKYGNGFFWFKLARDAALSNAEPVGEVGAMHGTEGFTMACFLAQDVPIGTKLFLHPSVPAPLSDEQIRKIWESCKDYGDDWKDVCGIARAIEAAHGIGFLLTNTGEQG